jgi:hypothetical protein
MSHGRTRKCAVQQNSGVTRVVAAMIDDEKTAAPRALAQAAPAELLRRG